MTRQREGLILLAVFLVGCAVEAPPPTDTTIALKQVQSTLRDFAIANEVYFEKRGTFTGDWSELRDHTNWRPTDSVRIDVRAVGPDGWAATAIHLRLGGSEGCAMAWGEATPSISTPGGIPVRGGNRIVCDGGLAHASG